MTFIASIWSSGKYASSLMPIYGRLVSKQVNLLPVYGPQVSKFYDFHCQYMVLR